MLKDEAVNVLRNAAWLGSNEDREKVEEAIETLASAQLDFDITVKINKAYDDGYEAGYLQGRHDWGDLDE